MCSNKVLYQPGETEVITTNKRRTRRRLNFQQVSFMTQCLRMLGNRLDMPIVKVSELLNRKSIYRYFYEMVIEQPELSKVQVTNRLQKALAAS